MATPLRIRISIGTACPPKNLHEYERGKVFFLFVDFLTELEIMSGVDQAR